MHSIVLITALTLAGGTYRSTCPSGTCPYQAAQPAATYAAPAYRVAPAPYAAPAPTQAAAPTTYYRRGYSQVAPAPANYAPAPVNYAPAPYVAPAPAAPAPVYYAPAPGPYRTAGTCPNGTCNRR